MKFDYKNYKFWVAMFGAIILFLQNLGQVVGFRVNDEILYGLVNSFCSVLVVMGIINNPTKKDQNDEEQESDDDQL